MILARKLMAQDASDAPSQNIADVFSTSLYTGTGATTQTINAGIDLVSNPGVVWIKGRSKGAAYYDNVFYDTVRGKQKVLASSGTSATAATMDSSGGVTGRDLYQFTSNGFSLGFDSTFYKNAVGESFVSWVFRKSPKFFDLAAITKTAGSNATVNFTALASLGMVIVRRTDGTGSWYVWHRSLAAGKLLYLEQTAGEASLGHVTVSGTTVTLVNGVIADGAYIVYAYAHDAAADGIIQCGSFTTDASGNSDVIIGWEPQYVMVRNKSTQSWFVADSARGFSASSWQYLSPNLDAAEATATSMEPTSSGFRTKLGTSANSAFIYMAVRRA